MTARFPDSATRAAAIIGIPFDLKPCPLEELSPEIMAAAKAAEREAHPLRIMRAPREFDADYGARVREFLSAQNGIITMPKTFVVEYLHASGFEAAVDALAAVNAAAADLRAIPGPATVTAAGEVTYSITLQSDRFAAACDRAVVAFGALLYPRRKRPGQWGWRARAKRHARRLAATDRKVAEWQRRALCRARPHFAPNRRTNRLLRRMFCEEVP